MPAEKLGQHHTFGSHQLIIILYYLVQNLHIPRALPGKFFPMGQRQLRRHFGNLGQVDTGQGPSLLLNAGQVSLTQTKSSKTQELVLNK